MHFHVLVEVEAVAVPRKASERRREDVEVRLDLSEQDVIALFAEKYAQGDPILINGRTIPSDMIKRLQIWEDIRSPEQIRAIVDAQRNESAARGILILSGISDVAVARSGKDVTERYITGPPGYESARLLASGKRQQAKSPEAPKTVFLVHGHDDAARETVARFLERLELRVIILHEQPNLGRTIIEKFETNSDVSFAVVLLTPDDKGCSAHLNPEEARFRARQNVVFELGYFIGKLGRNRVCALHKGALELPSDYQGIVYVSMSGPWQLELAKEIKQVIDIDLNRAI